MNHVPSIPDPLLAGLNAQQAAAVTHRGSALLIVAGAGSGKTTVLTRRIAALLRDGQAWPSQILAITFTNKAAGEMRERVQQLVGEQSRGMWISTFHSACVRILRSEAKHFGFTSSFTIYDSGDVRALLKRLVKEQEADRYGLSPASVQARISNLKNELIDSDAFSRQLQGGNPVDSIFLSIFRQYERELQRANAFDFDDLIAQTVYLFRSFPQIANAYRRRFRHLLVDEYQDTNHAQYALIHELTRPVDSAAVSGAPVVDNGMILHLPDSSQPFFPDQDPGLVPADLPGASLTVVGDSDQSIYAFRGADIRNITEFERDFPGAQVVLLEQNYRSTQNILDAANAVIKNNYDRQEKRLWSDRGAGEKIVGFIGFSQHDEAQFVADEIEVLARAGMAYSEMAVFYRTNSQSRALEEIFIRAAVPYQIMGGTKFYERAEIKDALAYLVAVANPADDMAVRRILNRPRRGIGNATETAIASYAAKHDLSFRDALGHGEELGLGPKLRTAIAQLDQLFTAATAILLPPEGTPVVGSSVSEGLTMLLDKSGYRRALLISKDPQDEARLENLDELVAVTREFARNNPEGTLIDFLTDVALVAAADDLDDESGAVSLMTMHTAKGLEYPAVFVTGVEEELIPHRISLDEPGGPAEERRLFYVALTRAKTNLFVSLAMTRAQFGQVAPAVPSRFLQEIPQELLQWRESAALQRTLGQGSGSASSRSGGYYSGGSGSGYGGAGAARTSTIKPLSTLADRFPNRVTGKVRDNGDLQLNSGDRIEHDDFGSGSVENVTGEGTKKIAHVRFDDGARKKLLIKVAPIRVISA